MHKPNSAKGLGQPQPIDLAFVRNPDDEEMKKTYHLTHSRWESALRRAYLSLRRQCERRGLKCPLDMSNLSEHDFDDVRVQVYPPNMPGFVKLVFTKVIAGEHLSHIAYTGDTVTPRQGSAAEQADGPAGWREGEGDIEEFFFPLPGASPRQQEAEYLRRWTSYRGHTEDNAPAPHERIFRVQFKRPSGKIATAEVGKQVRSQWSPVVAFVPHQMEDDPEPVIIIAMLNDEQNVEIPIKRVQKVWMFYDPQERARAFDKMTVKEHTKALTSLMHSGDQRDLEAYKRQEPRLKRLLELDAKGQGDRVDAAELSEIEVELDARAKRR